MRPFANHVAPKLGEGIKWAIHMGLLPGGWMLGANLETGRVVMEIEAEK